MNSSEQILVVFLSVALAVLLVIAIFVTVAVFKLVKSVQRITDKAEHIIENVEQVGQTFKNAAGPLAFFKVINNITGMMAKQHKRKR